VCAPPGEWTSKTGLGPVACRTNWLITTVNPQPYLDQLAATVEQLGATRSVLRAVITLADETVTLSDQELRDRLLALADRARLTQRPIVEVPGVVTGRPRLVTRRRWRLDAPQLPSPKTWVTAELRGRFVLSPLPLL
jgi:hypothetical protein